MPTDLLPVPLLKQASDGACLPACARMILAYLRLDYSESQLAHLLGTQPAGTPAYHIRRLETLGVKVAYGQISEARLRSYLSEGVPVIAFVQAGELTYWNTESFHAVVIVGLAGDLVLMNDPAFETMQSATWDELMLAWSEFDYAFAIITRE